MKSAGEFPKFVSNCITHVKPIIVGFLRHFFCFLIAGFRLRLSNKIIRLTISRVQIFSLLLAIIHVERKLNILTSKSYKVTKSAISPQWKMDLYESLNLSS